MSPANQMLLGELTGKNVIYFPDKDFLVEEERRITFRRFHARTEALAAGLQERGLRAGQRVAVLNHNSIELVEAYFGIMKAGGVAVPINVRLSPREVSTIIDDAEPSFLLAGADYLDKASPDELAYRGTRVFVMGGERTGLPGYEELLSGPAESAEPDVSDDDLAMLIYTSGTTGRPKGVMLTHRNLLCDAWATCVARRLSLEEITLVTAPLYQSGALGSMLGNVLRGNTIVLLDGFDPGRVLAAIEREKVSNALFVPTMIVKLLQFPELNRYDLSTMKTVIYGAAPMPVPTLKEAMERLGWEFMGACGATETGPAYIAFLDREDHRLDGSPEMEKRLASIGKEGINARVRIFGPDDRPVQAGEVGEIVVRGPHIMKGYWKMPEATAEALRGGWYHTGDMGVMDEEGYIFIVDRKSDMIISGGFNIYPREIENILAGHPAVLETAVVGVPHEVWGETPRAWLVLRPGVENPGEEAFMAYLRENLAAYKLPRGGFVFAGELPRNASGKVLKRELRLQTGRETK